MFVQEEKGGHVKSGLANFLTEQVQTYPSLLLVFLSAKHFYVSEFPRALTYVRTYERTY